MPKANREQLAHSLNNLGLSRGHIVFIAADLLRVGYFNKTRKQTYADWIWALQQAVGQEGTLVIPAYTTTFPRWKKSDALFTLSSPTSSGSLSDAFQANHATLRSHHPTNSCFAIGPHAQYILDGHDHNSTSYLPYQRVVELGGKNLMAGAFSDHRLAPMAMHCAQEILGLTEKNWSSGLTQCYFYNNNKKEKSLFTRRDVGGCTAAGYKTLGHHIINNAVDFGYIIQGFSAYIDCRKSLDIFIKLYRESPYLLKCDDKRCRSCYGSPIHKSPLFWLEEASLLLQDKFNKSNRRTS